MISPGRIRIALATLAAALAATPTFLVASDVIQNYYSPQVGQERVQGLIDSIRVGFESPAADDRMRAHSVLRDLGRSISVYSPMPPPLHTPQDRRDLNRIVRVGDGAPPPEFKAWAAMARRLLHEQIGPYMDAFLADSALVWSTLAPAGSMGWDSPSYRGLALDSLGKRIEPAWYLGNLGPTGIGLAIDLLASADPERRRGIFTVFNVAHSFEGLDTDRASALTDTLTASVLDADPEVAARAAYALRWPGLDRSRIAPALVAGIRSTDEDVAMNCAGALSALPALDPGTFRALADLLEHPNHNVSREILQRLARESGSDSVLVAALSSRHSGTRSNAILALGRSGMPAVELVPLLIERLADSGTQYAAATVCAWLGPAAQATLPALQAAAANPGKDFLAPSALLGAIVAVAPDSTAAASLAHDYWGSADRNARQGLLLWLPPLGGAIDRFLPDLVAVLEDSTIGQYRDVLEAIAAQGSAARQAAPAVAACLTHENPWVRKQALETLAAIEAYPCAVRGELERLQADPGSAIEQRILVTSLLDDVQCD